MLTGDFNQSIDFWIKELEQYNLIQLCSKPSPYNWSLGQVYMHLIDATFFFITQIKICVTTNDNVNEEASVNAKILFRNNDFQISQ